MGLAAEYRRCAEQSLKGVGERGPPRRPPSDDRTSARLQDLRATWFGALGDLGRLPVEPASG